MSARGLAAMVAALALSVLGHAAPAAELRVLTAGALHGAVAAVLPEFERRTAHHVTLLTDTAGNLARRIAGGEAFDLAVLTPATAAGPQRAQLAGPGVPLAAVGIGVAVRAGAPAPDLATLAGFTAALLAARSVAMIDPQAGGSSGIYLAGLFERLGIAAQMTPKLVLVPGGLTAERVASGQAEIALQQASELVGVPGTVFVGPIPAEVQSETVYVAVLGPQPGAAAQALLAELSGPELRAVLPARGLRAP